MPRAFCPGGLHPASVCRFRIVRASSPPPGFLWVLFCVCVPAGGSLPLFGFPVCVSAGVGSAVSARRRILTRGVQGNPPTRSPPCVHGGRGGLVLVLRSAYSSQASADSCKRLQG